MEAFLLVEVLIFMYFTFFKNIANIFLDTMCKSSILKLQYFIQFLITVANEKVARKKLKEIKTKTERHVD